MTRPIMILLLLAVPAMAADAAERCADRTVHTEAEEKKLPEAEEKKLAEPDYTDEELASIREEARRQTETAKLVLDTLLDTVDTMSAETRNAVYKAMTRARTYTVGFKDGTQMEVFSWAPPDVDETCRRVKFYGSGTHKPVSASFMLSQITGWW